MKAFKIVGGALALSALSVSFTPGANAVPKLTHAKQVSITRAANSMQGTAQGGSYTHSGAGLTLVTLPTIDAVGKVSITNAAGMTSAADTTFSYSASIGQADIVNTPTTVEAGLGAGSFGDMTTKGSAQVAGGGAGVAVGTITIAANGNATAVAGAGQGSSATGIYSTNFTSDTASIENRRVATSSNTQTVVDSERQETKATLSGSGLTAVTAFGLGDGTAAAAGTTGTAHAVTVKAGGIASALGLANGFTANQSITDGQNTAAMGLNSVSPTRPAYGNVTEAAGGTTAGALAFTDLNNITAVGGGAGTTSSLSFIQEMTAFN
jgi:hypothetical protein